MSLLPSCQVISFISFARTSVRPLVCIRAPVHQISIRWPRFLTRRCPCALDFPPITITYLGLVSSSSHVFTFLTLLHTLDSFLFLPFPQIVCLPARAACVCVPSPVPRDTNLFHTTTLAIFVLKQGDMACVQGPCPAKLPHGK